MKYLVFSLALLSMAQHAQAGPFGIFSRRGGSMGGGGQAAAPAGGFATAQDAAWHMARLGRIGHFGGNSGYEGVGCGATPQAAEMACCYRSRWQPREVGLAQGAGGMWFACCRY
jgi:hypothetical protein